VLRRLDCVLALTKKRVLETQASYKGKIENLDSLLRKASGLDFYNTSRYDFENLLANAPHLAPNLRNYIAGFSSNMREVLEKFDFDNAICKLDEGGGSSFKCSSVSRTSISTRTGSTIRRWARSQLPLSICVFSINR